jgi:DsbC/DsbD-like thiol-disulfide interchange protein
MALAQTGRGVVKVRSALATDAVHAGSRARAVVLAEIASGYHVNDHRPTREYLIPTELKFDAPKQVTVEKVVYPQGELKKFAFSDAPLSVYQGVLKVGVLFRVARATPPGEYTLEGQFRYQACNDHACLPPVTLPVTLAVKVVPRQTSLKRLNTDLFAGVQFD